MEVEILEILETAAITVSGFLIKKAGNIQRYLE